MARDTAITNDQGFQVLTNEMAKHGDEATFAKKNPGAYARYLVYQQQREMNKEMLRMQMPVVSSSRARLPNLRGCLPARLTQGQPQRSQRDKAARSSKTGGVSPQAPLASSGLALIPGAAIVRGVGDAIASALPTPSYSKLAQEYGMTLEQAKESIYVVKNPADLRAIKEGIASRAPGTYVYDPVKRDMFIKIGDDRLMEVGKEMSKEAEKKVPRKDREMKMPDTTMWK
ncbi:MAG: hypothetical protein MZV63_15555 [Marinilabiliales bacterium]|nr:hypothetical protein [Marinilabiliales bacterium]